MDYIGVIGMMIMLPIIIIAIVVDNACASGYNMVMTICVLVFVVGGVFGALCLKAR